MSNYPWEMMSNPTCPRGMEVQTVLFPVGEFTVNQAKTWARKHDMHARKVDTTEQYHRLRQRDPDDFVYGSFRTINFGDSGIKAVVGCPRVGKESDW